MTLLSIKTKEGHSFKVLIELIQKYIKDGCWIINKDGMFLSGMDTKTTNGTKMIVVNLNRFNFTKYKCPDEPIVISMNMLHFYRMLKPIKKKDNTLTLYIEENEEHKLYITINQSGETQKRGNLSHINISNARPQSFQPPEDYADPIVITSKDFQQIKTLNKVSKQMELVIRGRAIDLICNRDDVMSRSITLGDTDDDDDDQTDENEDVEEYRHKFDSDQILDLTKIASTSNNVQIYTSPDNPIHFKMNVGTLGTVGVYIKSKEMIDNEDTEQEN